MCNWYSPATPAPMMTASSFSGVLLCIGACCRVVVAAQAESIFLVRPRRLEGCGQFFERFPGSGKTLTRSALRVRSVSDLAAVLAGRHAQLGAKHPRHVRLVGEADGRGDLLQRQVAHAQQVPGALDAPLDGEGICRR